MTINKVVIIMGASSGIGEATAHLLAERGAKLVLVARRLDRLEAIQAKHPEADIVIRQADVTDYAAVEAVVKTALDTFGKVDVLFNNAGIMPLSPFAAYKIDEWNQMIDVNIRGVLHGIAAALPVMQNQKGG
ncbi:MAG: SDR family oxidoreductase, partial [Exiguobacterium mexicanum]